CPYYRARAAVDGADCVVANHDLVMADLALGGGVVLPAPEESFYVFDEAHRLGDTAIGHFGAQCALEASSAWLERLQAQAERQRAPLAGSGAALARLEALPALAAAAGVALRRAAPLFAALIPAEEPRRHRFVQGVVPEQLRLLCAELAAAWSSLAVALAEYREALEAGFDRVDFPLRRAELEPWLQT